MQQILLKIRISSEIYFRRGTRGAVLILYAEQTKSWGLRIESRSAFFLDWVTGQRAYPKEMTTPLNALYTFDVVFNCCGCDAPNQCRVDKSRNLTLKLNRFFDFPHKSKGVSLYPGITRKENYPNNHHTHNLKKYEMEATKSTIYHNKRYLII